MGWPQTYPYQNPYFEKGVESEFWEMYLNIESSTLLLSSTSEFAAADSTVVGRDSTFR